MATKKKQVEMPKVQIRGRASVLTPEQQDAVELRRMGLNYTPDQRQREAARNAGQLEEVLRRIHNLGGPDAVRAEVGRVYKLLGMGGK